MLCGGREEGLRTASKGTGTRGGDIGGRERRRQSRAVKETCEKRGGGIQDCPGQLADYGKE